MQSGEPDPTSRRAAKKAQPRRTRNCSFLNEKRKDKGPVWYLFSLTTVLLLHIDMEQIIVRKNSRIYSIITWYSVALFGAFVRLKDEFPCQ